jgi:hypothetical protein
VPGYSFSGTNSDITAVAKSICNARAQGVSPAGVAHIMKTQNPSNPWQLPYPKVIKAAEKDVCPAYLPKPPMVLVSLSGSGIANSQPVTVTSGTLTVRYSYNCSSFGGSGNFIADFQTPDQSSLSSDDQQIANVVGASGSATTTIYPQNVGSRYYLSINSECNWSVKVVSP